PSIWCEASAHSYPGQGPSTTPVTPIGNTDVVITLEAPTFGPAVLRSLNTLVPAGMTQADLALELGLSAHLQMCDIEVGDAIAEMWAVRQAILEASDMD